MMFYANFFVNVIYLKGNISDILCIYVYLFVNVM